MNKYDGLLFLTLIICSSFYSCTNKNYDPIETNPNPKVGSIYIISTPNAAQIWVDNMFTGKMTPDSITNISSGSHKVILKLAGFINDTVSVTILEGVQTSLNIALVGDQSVSEFGPAQIWETASTDSTKPSGIILKLGTASSIVSGNNNLVDIYFSSNGYLVASAFDKNGRNTSFFVGLSDSLTDGALSPIFIQSWVTQIAETSQNYFFLFDIDSHYSKMVIVEKGGTNGSPSNPAWVKLKWLYNNSPNDPRF